MFRFHKPRPTLSLFHRPQVPQSVAILNHIKAHSAVKKQLVELEVATYKPSKDQLHIITGYLGGGYAAGKLVQGANGLEDAVRILDEDETKLNVPFLVEWFNGKVVLGDDEVKVDQLLGEIEKTAE